MQNLQNNSSAIEKHYASYTILGKVLLPQRERRMFYSLADGIIYIDENNVLLHQVSQVLIKAMKKVSSFYDYQTTLFKGFLGNDVDEAAAAELQLFHYIETYMSEIEHLDNEIDLLSLCSKYGNEIDLSLLYSNDGDTPLPPLPNIKIVKVESDPAKWLQDFNHFLKTVKTPNKEMTSQIHHLITDKNLPSSEIASKEIRSIAQKVRNEVPQDGEGQARLLFTATTDNSLIIKNKNYINAIKENCRNREVEEVFNTLDEEKLAEVFFRYKPLFLAFRHNCRLKSKVNRIRRLADKHHKPLPFTCIANYYQVSSDEGQDILDKASNLELIKLLNYIPPSDRKLCLYRVRNGKTFIKDQEAPEEKLIEVLFKDRDKVNSFCATSKKVDYRQKKAKVEEHLLARLKNKGFGEKAFLVDPDVDYALPTSAKQMMGGVPWGTRIKCKKNGANVVGIHWFNTDDRVDLDLHAQLANSSVGWNSYLDDNNKNIQYSGDLTTAPIEKGGASEMMTFNAQIEGDVVFSMSNFTSSDKVPFTIFLSHKKDLEGSLVFRAYVEKQDVGLGIGFVSSNVFYVWGGTINTKIIPETDNASYLNALKEEMATTVLFSEIAEMTGARIITPAELADLQLDPDFNLDYIDLRLSELSPTTLLDIFQD